MTRLRSLALLACVILSPLCAEAQHLVDPAEFQKSCEEKFTKFAGICVRSTSTTSTCDELNGAPGSEIYWRWEDCPLRKRNITAGYRGESKTSIEKISDECALTTTTQESCNCAPCPDDPR